MGKKRIGWVRGRCHCHVNWSLAGAESYVGIKRTVLKRPAHCFSSAFKVRFSVALLFLLYIIAPRELQCL